jgi:hypothetical protein
MQFWTLDTLKRLKYSAKVQGCPFTEYLSTFANKRKDAEFSGISRKMATYAAPELGNKAVCFDFVGCAVSFLLSRAAARSMR